MSHFEGIVKSRYALPTECDAPFCDKPAVAFIGMSSTGEKALGHAGCADHLYDALIITLFQASKIIELPELKIMPVADRDVAG